MTLTQATLIPGLLLVVVGLLFFANTPLVVSTLKALPRSKRAAYVFFGAGAAWFLYNIWHLSPADFGDHRVILLAFFGAVALLSFPFVPDFLAVRGLCVLMLVGAGPLLDAAFMDPHKQRLWMVGTVYLGIFLALFLGAVPYRARDFLEWLYQVRGRARVLGAVLALWGGLLAAVAFTY